MIAEAEKDNAGINGISPGRRVLSIIFIHLSEKTALLSLLLFLFFLYGGPLLLVNLGLEGNSLLVFNAALSLSFFLQHSIMMRKSFRNFLARYLNRIYHGALYSLFSGLFLIAVVLHWQSSSRVLFAPPEAIVITMRILFFLSLVFFAWGIIKLDFFDPFGIKEIRLHLKEKAVKQIPFTVKGPYRYVRHPLYLSVLFQIWLYPYLTADRLLFNIVWTLWITAGTFLEERDLVEHFGDQYRDYRKRVPVLIPLPGKRMK